MRVEGMERLHSRAVDGLIAARAWRELAHYRVVAKMCYAEVERRRTLGHVHPCRPDSAYCYSYIRWPVDRAVPCIRLDPAMEVYCRWRARRTVSCLWCERLRVCAMAMFRRFQLTATNSQAPGAVRGCIIGLAADGYPSLRGVRAEAIRAQVKTKIAMAVHLVELMPLLGVPSFMEVLSEQGAVLAGGAALTAAARRGVQHSDVDIFVRSARALHAVISGAIRAWRVLRATVDSDLRGKYCRHHAVGAEHPCNNVYDITITCEGRTSVMQLVYCRVFPRTDICVHELGYFAHMGEDAYVRSVLQAAGGIAAPFDIAACAVEWRFKGGQGLVSLPGGAYMSFAALTALVVGDIRVMWAGTKDERVAKYAAKGFVVHPQALRWRTYRAIDIPNKYHPFAPVTYGDFLEEVGSAIAP